MMKIRPRLAALLLLAVLAACAGQPPALRADPAPPRPAGTALTAGSFARIAADTDALLAGKTPSPAAQNLFTAYDNSAHAYTRNPGCIAAGLDLSCVSAANSANADGTGGNRGCVTLVTPLHGVTNRHFVQPYANGVVHYFVDRANAVHARKIVASAQVGTTDLELVTFDAPLPASVVPARVLSAGAMRLLPVNTPLLSTNQQKRVSIVELTGMMGGELVVQPAAAPARRAWTSSPPAVVGDSDSPVFVLVERRPCLLFTYHSTVTGPAISENLTAIRSLVGDKYPLDVADVR